MDYIKKVLAWTLRKIRNFLARTLLPFSPCDLHAIFCSVHRTASLSGRPRRGRPARQRRRRPAPHVGSTSQAGDRVPRRPPPPSPGTETLARRDDQTALALPPTTTTIATPPTSSAFPLASRRSGSSHRVPARRRSLLWIIWVPCSSILLCCLRCPLSPSIQKFLRFSDPSPSRFSSSAAS